MTIFGKVALAAVAAATLGSAAQAYKYVGSWSVYNDAAPTWYGHGDTGPEAYTAQEAAAFIFGGKASDYTISTVGPDARTIDHRANYDVIGVGQQVFAEDYSNKYLGKFYGPTNGYNCCGESFAHVNAASAFVRDNGVTSPNYAFTAGVPEPASWALMLSGFALVGAAARRRTPAAVAA